MQFERIDLNWSNGVCARAIDETKLMSLLFAGDVGSAGGGGDGSGAASVVASR